LSFATALSNLRIANQAAFQHCFELFLLTFSTAFVMDSIMGIEPTSDLRVSDGHWPFQF